MAVEITNRELATFFGAIALAMLVLVAGSMGWFDPLTAGIVIIAVVAFFAMGQYLESKEILSPGASLMWLTFSFAVVMILVGAIDRGIIPVAFSSSTASALAIEVSNAMLYALAIIGVFAVVVVAYAVTRRK